MRVIDKNRLIAMKEIKACVTTISNMTDFYEKTYKDTGYSAQDTMDNLDEYWKLIVNNNIRLTEILRENGL